MKNLLENINSQHISWVIIVVYFVSMSIISFSVV
jgi:hypothetical protein